MKWWFIPLGLLTFGALALRGSGHSPVGCAWWFVLGVALGLAAGFVTFVLATRPRRWRVKVSTNLSGKVVVEVVRLFGSACVGELDPRTDDFDDALHRTMAEARSKAAALRAA